MKNLKSVAINFDLLQKIKSLEDEIARLEHEVYELRYELDYVQNHTERSE